MSEISDFITEVEGDIVAVAEAAWSQTKAELLQLEASVLQMIKVDIQEAVEEVAGAGTLEEIETDLLNLWAKDSPQIIEALSSGALQLLIAAAKTAVTAAL